MAGEILEYKLLTKTAKAPICASAAAACFDVFADSAEFRDTMISYGTGIALEIPPGFHVEVYARSSVSNKGLYLANSIGIIDRDYTGEIKVRFYRMPNSEAYNIGERIAQIRLVPTIATTLQETHELSDTIRGNKGFGSTGV